MKSKCKGNGACGGYAFAIISILIGVMLLLSSTGVIPKSISENIFTWQSGLKVLGVYLILTRHFFTGFVALLTGFYFSPLIGCEYAESLRTPAAYWSMVLIAFGINLLFFKRKKGMCGGEKHEFKSETINTEDGFINSVNTFGAAEYIVLSPVFKGGYIKNVFSGTRIDLRKTTIIEGETFIDVDCNFSGIEIFVPEDWNVVFKTYYYIGGAKDKRRHHENIDHNKTLIIRGKLTFGGIEVK